MGSVELQAELFDFSSGEKAVSLWGEPGLAFVLPDGIDYHAECLGNLLLVSTTSNGFVSAVDQDGSVEGF